MSVPLVGSLPSPTNSRFVFCKALVSPRLALQVTRASHLLNAGDAKVTLLSLSSCLPGHGRLCLDPEKYAHPLLRLPVWGLFLRYPWSHPHSHLHSSLAPYTPWFCRGQAEVGDVGGQDKLGGSRAVRHLLFLGVRVHQKLSLVCDSRASIGCFPMSHAAP